MIQAKNSMKGAMALKCQVCWSAVSSEHFRYVVMHGGLVKNGLNIHSCGAPVIVVSKSDVVVPT